MRPRIFTIELRRSAAVLFGALITAFGWAMISDPERWEGLWMAAVLVHVGNLGLLWPLALAAGAWLGRRDRSARITDLLASTPRPVGSRTVPLAALFAGCLGGGFAVSLLEAVGRAALTAAYRPAGWFWPVLVGMLGIATAGVLGLALGRMMPWRLTAPSLALGGIVLLLAPLILWEDTGSSALLLIPGYLGLTDEYSTVDWRALAGQAVWFAAIAAAGWTLLAAGTRRGKLLAALPAVAGLAAALALLPPADHATTRDPLAAELVCAAGQPRVCVTRLYEPALPQLVDAARSALSRLARLPDPPTSVVQETSGYGTYVVQRHDTVHFGLHLFGDGAIAVGPDGLEAAILEGAGTWGCGAADGETEKWLSIEAARTAAGLWLQDVTAVPESTRPPIRELVGQALTTLRALPADAQVARIAAMREAALACRPDLYEVLTRSSP